MEILSPPAINSSLLTDLVNKSTEQQDKDKDAAIKKGLQVYENINFEGIDEDLAAFQEDEMVQQALHRGVDLMKYGRELEIELRQVR